MSPKTNNELDFEFLFSHSDELGIPLPILNEIEQYYAVVPNPESDQIKNELITRIIAIYNPDEKIIKSVYNLLGLDAFCSFR